MSGPNPEFDAAYPEMLRAGERKLLGRRREKAELKKEGEPLNEDLLVGVGLSGGGIRSATFALGIFQGLAAKSGLLREIDFLSTVSGGGYFGSFFGRLLTRDYVKSWRDVEDVLLGRKEPKVLGFLRENGRYLAPNGAGDALLSGAALLRNWISIHVVLGFFVLALFLGLQTLRVFLETSLASLDRRLPPTAGAEDLIWLSPLIWLPLVSLALAVSLGWAYWLVEPERDAISEGAGKDGKLSPIPPVAALALVLVLSLVLAIATRNEAKYAALWGSVAAMAALAFGFWKLALWNLPDKRPMETMERYEKMDQSLYRNNAERNRLSLWVTAALVVTGLLLALALVDSLGQSLYAVLSGDKGVGPWLAGLFSSLGVLAGFGRWITMFFSKGPGKDRPSIPMKLVATVAALLLVLLLLVTMNAGSHAVAWGGEKPAGAPPRLLQPDKEEKVFDVQLRGSAAPLGMDLRVRDAGKKRVKPAAEEEAANRNPMFALLGFASAFLLSILFGQTWPFVNRSSHLSLYAARLTRAYLGASNRKRLDGQNLTQPLEGDNIDLSSYWPPPDDSAAPLHLINVTINETIDGQSQVQQQDRKGTGLALGPWGMSAGIRHHAVMPLGDPSRMNPEGKRIFEIYPLEGWRVFDYPKPGEGESSIQSGSAVLEPLERPERTSWLAGLRGWRRGGASESGVKPSVEAATFTGEALPLGDWLSISGAAFSTGTGFRTSLGLSILAGFANVRLGRWWDSGVVRNPKKDGSGKWQAKRKITLRIEDAFARLFPVQTYLLDEFLARFPGTARRHWYLTDGGHFENMGGYELLRRRLRFIVIVDAEMDADSTFEGLANLVRKARLDFGAEVRFLTERQLDKVVVDEVRPYVGALSSSSVASGRTSSRTSPSPTAAWRSPGGRASPWRTPPWPGSPTPRAARSPGSSTSSPP